MYRTECSCDRCISACANGSPGWFLPGEAEKAAEFLAMDFGDFICKYLIWDYWSIKSEDTKVLAPVKMDKMMDIPLSEKGKTVSWGYAFENGRCIFLNKENRCDIHQVKPFECSAMDCKLKKQKGVRSFIADEWKKHWDQKRANELNDSAPL